MRGTRPTGRPGPAPAGEVSGLSGHLENSTSTIEYSTSMAARAAHLQHLERLFREFPVVAILGPRQIGKTTLAGQFAATTSGPVHTFDLERPSDLRKLDDPMLALEDLRGLVVLDEIHRLDQPAELLKVAADHFPGVRIVATGSSTLGASSRSSVVR